MHENLCNMYLLTRENESIRSADVKFIIFVLAFKLFVGILFTSMPIVKWILLHIIRIEHIKWNINHTINWIEFLFVGIRVSWLIDMWKPNGSLISYVVFSLCVSKINCMQKVKKEYKSLLFLFTWRISKIHNCVYQKP